MHTLAQRSLTHVWHPCTQMQRAWALPPLAIEHAQGPWLFDEHGKRYFDATSSWWVNLFGHGDARIAEALKDQIDRLSHTMLAGCTHRPAVELAERLSKRTGGALDHCFFASDGASAVEIALKMSVHYWRNQGQAQKREFVCLQRSYHGETIGALSVTDVAIFRDAYDPLLLRPHRVMSPDARQAAPHETDSDVATRAAQALETLLKARHEHIAALIVEPLVQGAAGMAMYHPSYLRLARTLCDRYGVHLIADEIAVGCGRTGSFFAFEQAAEAGAAPLWPDLVCLSKGISGGFLPLSLVLVREPIYQAFLSDETARAFLHSHSYSGNALACRAALAVLDHFELGHVLAENQQRARALTQALQPLTEDTRIEHVRHRGMIWAFDVKETYAGARFAERFAQAGRQHELLIRPIGNSVYLMPPYAFDEPLAAWLGQRLMATLGAVLSDNPTHADRAADPATA